MTSPAEASCPNRVKVVSGNPWLFVSFSAFETWEANALVIGFPEGGGGGGEPRADVGEYGDFMGTLQQISALVVEEMWGLRFLNALLSGNMWGLHFCSTERRLGTSKESIGQNDIEHLAKMCFLSLEDAEAFAEHHMSICQRRRQVQQKRQRKTTRKQDDKNCQVDGQEESVYCICRRGEDQGFMIQCSNCNKWFHGECVRA